MYNIIEYELLTENINSKNFEKFLIKMLSDLDDNIIKKSLFIMDNCSIHLSQIIISFMKEKKLKVLFTVPYESSFNPIELAFGFIENKIYKKYF